MLVQTHDPPSTHMKDKPIRSLLPPRGTVRSLRPLAVEDLVQVGLREIGLAEDGGSLKINRGRVSRLAKLPRDLHGPHQRGLERERGRGAPLLDLWPWLDLSLPHLVAPDDWLVRLLHAAVLEDVDDVAEAARHLVGRGEGWTRKTCSLPVSLTAAAWRECGLWSGRDL